LPEAASTTGHTVARVDAATVRAAVPEPIRFGDWVMTHRDFVVVRVRTSEGVDGWAFTLTRDAPIAALVARSVAGRYVGRAIDEPADAFGTAQRSNLATLSSGAGLRALSVVDLALWDALGRTRGESVARLLGAAPSPMPVTAIVGYPPTMDAEGVAAQVGELFAAGWRRFKLPMGATVELSYARLAAAAGAAPGAVVSTDAAWVFRELDEAIAFARGLPVRLGWLEDVFAPGDAATLAALRAAVDVPIAMGDEQGGSYYPDALLAADAVDVVRVDATCMGGVTGARRIVERCRQAGVAFAPHMFAHVHSQIFSGLGHADVPVEWGVPWTGVDPYADSLRQPVVRDGLMDPLPEEPGFGPLRDPAWLADQDCDDPEGILR
jgi:L-alanine-DL-glutamate epimerase-like enolase superfamily enzyme